MDSEKQVVNEVGRELRVDELVVATVYVAIKEGRRNGATMWYAGRDGDLAVFKMGAISTTLMLSIREDGALVDDTGTRIRVFEYLGEV